MSEGINGTGKTESHSELPPESDLNPSSANNGSGSSSVAEPPPLPPAQKQREQPLELSEEILTIVPADVLAEILHMLNAMGDPSKNTITFLRDFLCMKNCYPPELFKWMCLSAMVLTILCGGLMVRFMLLFHTRTRQG